jgi:hypothetical protein
LEIAITDVHGSIIPSEVVQQTDAVSKFLVSFQPAEPGEFSVNISFNQEQLNGERHAFTMCATCAGSPFVCHSIGGAETLLKYDDALLKTAPLVKSELIAASQIDQTDRAKNLEPVKEIDEKLKQKLEKEHQILSVLQRISVLDREKLELVAAGNKAHILLTLPDRRVNQTRVDAEVVGRAVHLFTNIGQQLLWSTSMNTVIFSCNTCRE